MKANSKIMQTLTKGLVLSSVLFCSLNGVAQSNRAVRTDTKLGKIGLTDATGYAVNELYVQPDEIIQLKIPVLNANHGQALPAGTCKLKIGLGTNLVVDQSYNLNSTALSSYFKWTVVHSSGQDQIVGDLVNALPADVKSVDVAFSVKGTVVGISTITANFLTTNHNSAILISDDDGSNNSSFLSYTVSSKKAPSTTTSIVSLENADCAVNVAFAPDVEVNLARYEVEASKDGVSFEKMTSINATGNTSYNTSFNLPTSLQVAALTVRIKSYERAGKVLYSSAKVVSGVCKRLPLQLALYPNPVKGTEPLTIKAMSGKFDGRYKIKLLDIAGKTVAVKDITVSNVTNVQFDYGTIAAGKYILQVGNFENPKIGSLKFEKL